MRAFALLVMMFAGAPVLAQEEYVSYLQRSLLLEIAECSSPACVERALASAPYSDPPLRLIAASKLAQMSPALGQPMLLAAIPRDPVAFWFCYSVTAPSLGSRFKKVQDLYDLYFPAAAAAVAESGLKVRDFLLLQIFADGAIAPMIAEDVASIRKRNPAAYCKALATLHASLRSQFGACDRPRGRKK